jgi:hypothetical protein
MPTIKGSLDANRVQSAARNIGEAAGGKQAYWGKDSLDQIRGGAASEALSQVKSGNIRADQLPEVARELLRRGTDWNPFNNYASQKKYSSDILSQRITGTTLQEAASAVAAVAEQLGVPLD